MVDLRLSRLLNCHGNRNALSGKYLISFIFRTYVFQKELEHRSVRMDIGAKDFEILGFAPYAVAFFVLAEINVLRRTDSLYNVHSRACVFLALMYIHGLFDREDLTSAVKSDLTALLKHVRI